MNETNLLELLDERKFKELKEELGNMYPVDIAALLEEVDERQIVLIIRLLGKEEAAETFTYMSSETREFLINALTDSVPTQLRSTANNCLHGLRQRANLPRALSDDNTRFR